MRRLFEAGGSEATQSKRRRRRAGVADEIIAIDPDVLCLLEAPSSAADMRSFCANDLGGAWSLIEAGDGKYGIKGAQWIWFLVRSNLAGSAELLPIDTFKDFAGTSWSVNYWGDFETKTHSHYRQPQTLVLNWLEERIEFIGLHLKSKFVRGARADWNAGGARRKNFIRDAIKARIKLTTESANVRDYIDRKFAQRPDPCIFVMGDLNDGPGKEYFEQNYLFFDLLSNIQGDVFFARRFLNHALFDFGEDLRWTVEFEDFIDADRNPKILLDHILFTQPLVDGSKPFEIHAGAGLVEHEAHALVNAGLPKSAQTSDHSPVSVTLSAP